MREKGTKEIGGGDLAGFVIRTVYAACRGHNTAADLSLEMGTKFAYIRFFLYLCSGKEKNGQVGVAEIKDRRVMCL